MPIPRETEFQKRRTRSPKLLEEVTTSGLGVQLNRERELGLDRRETGRLLSIGGVLVPDGNDRIVREELRLVTTGVPVVREGTCRAAT